MPGPIVALITLTALTFFLELPVETIGTRFGGIPQALPQFTLPDFLWETVRLLVTPTLTIALLGAVESLLYGRMADLISGLPRHDPNQELMAQGVANMVVPFFWQHACQWHPCPHGDQRALWRHISGGRAAALRDAGDGGAGRSAAGRACAAERAGGHLVARGLSLPTFPGPATTTVC